MTPLAQTVELLPQLLELFVRQLFQVDELRPRPLQRANELVELEVDGDGVAVLRVLDQEHHEERDDRRAGVDDELPGVREMKDGARYRPHEDDQHRQREGPRRADAGRRPVRELAKEMVGAVHVASVSIATIPWWSETLVIA